MPFGLAFFLSFLGGEYLNSSLEQAGGEHVGPTKLSRAVANLASKSLFVVVKKKFPHLTPAPGQFVCLFVGYHHYYAAHSQYVENPHATPNGAQLPAHLAFPSFLVRLLEGLFAQIHIDLS